ncbi:alpha/beta hydrolase [Phanerochaete sordida]|uniref:Alpha/beta hydrolase n=1 Tax=Phanerochaete sordida TaxID=48140 RepID=A0A9P3GHB3_9APHY|nr:alpha/beta hydrolase [Phanerochaete sordida]
MSLCENCVKGFKHEGTPEGTIEEIDGIDCYVATPKGDYDKNVVVLMLTDIFGLALVNNKLLADDFARHGFKVVVPNLFQEPAPADGLNPGSTFDLGAWFGRNGVDYSEPRARKVLAALKAQGIAKVGVTGYCYGARTGFNLAFENAIAALVVAHPSLLQVPQDMETLKAKSNVPVLINSCEVDQMFPLEAQAKTDELLGNGQYAPGYLRTYWEGCTHGFSVRGDLSDPKVLAGKEGAFKATCNWFHKYLLGKQ